jgi:hypothetical protein
LTGRLSSVDGRSLDTTGEMKERKEKREAKEKGYSRNRATERKTRSSENEPNQK